MTEKAKSSVLPEFDTEPLFPDVLSAVKTKTRRYKRVQEPIWTENKARFIQQYLRFFVQITRHGTYIDGFAGPQYSDRLDAWSAALVLSSDPKWLRHFFLCEKSREGVAALRKLKGDQPEPRDRKGRRIKRTIDILPGDFNVTVDKILQPDKVGQKEAAFCLLDQRTFECHWATLKKLAEYKEPPHTKIELLYFLGIGWLHRAISGVKKPEKLSIWWGNKDWQSLRLKNHWEIAEIVRRRFEEELGYSFSAAYPIFDRDEGNKVMYYMIHASDHDEAPALMVRAHRKAVRSLPQEVQRPLKFKDS